MALKASSVSSPALAMVSSATGRKASGTSCTECAVLCSQHIRPRVLVTVAVVLCVTASCREPTMCSMERAKSLASRRIRLASSFSRRRPPERTIASRLIW